MAALRVLRVGAIAAAACLVATPARAQERRWEVEIHGGAVAGTAASEGSRTPPAAGAPLVTSNPIFPSRATSSWFFGDGAALLNGVNADFGVTGRIAPLDALFSTLESGRGGVAGVRVRRTMSPRWSAEFGVEAMPSTGSAPAGFAEGIEASRASFTTAFAGLLGTGPFSAVAIDATAESDAGRRRETAATAAVNVHWQAWRSLAPYVTIGGGVMAGSGSLPSARLEGRYRFSILGEVPVSETDRVAVRYERPASFVAVLGGGFRRELSDRWGLRIDARVLVGPDSTRVRVDAQPATVRGTPAGFVESFTNPGIQFSNDPATGRRSSLSGPPLDGFEVFNGGVRARTLVTVGLARRF